MPASWPHLVVFNGTLGSPPLAAETTVATLTGVTTDGPNERVLLQGVLLITIGTAGTSITVRIRRDSTTGTLVSSTAALTQGIAAGAICDIPFAALDTPGDVVNQQYNLTAQIANASAVSTNNGVMFTAQIFPAS